MSYQGSEIRQIICDALLPIVGRKCALYNLPYHDNIGDVLIWEGEEAFFKDNGIECVGRFSIYTFDCCEQDPDTTICIHGGGHLGDVWRGFQKEINNIVTSYPNNRIVIFPQSVFYHDKDNIKVDSKILGGHKDLFICARDSASYDILCDSFSNPVLLVPDMALYLEKAENEKRLGKTLFMKRTDKEAVNTCQLNLDGAEIHDWPTVEYIYFSRKPTLFTKRNIRIRRKLLRLGLKLFPGISMFRFIDEGLLKKLQSDKIDIGTKWRICHNELNYLVYLNQYKMKGRLNRLIDWFANNYYRPITIAYGKEFINQYDVVYSTRLHGGILSWLLGKKCFLIDNSNHKIAAFYATWGTYLGDKITMM